MRKLNSAIYSLRKTHRERGRKKKLNKIQQPARNFILYCKSTSTTSKAWLRRINIFFLFSCCTWRRIQILYNFDFVVETLTEHFRSLKDFWRAEQCKFFSCSAWVTVGFWKKLKWSNQRGAYYQALVWFYSDVLLNRISSSFKRYYISLRRIHSLIFFCSSVLHAFLYLHRYTCWY